jgi:hypothetical protein
MEHRMNQRSTADTPKAPRWISTEAGQWAWQVDLEWRGYADRALHVAERRRLLDQAERMRSDSTQA